MSSAKERHRPLEGSFYGEMRVLSEIARAPQISQRSLARRVGVSLTLTNFLLHKLAQRGYLRITRASLRGWLYTLTPAGFSRKVQLTLSYIHRFIDHYQRIQETLREELKSLGLNGESRVALYGPVLREGSRELGQLIYLALKELGIEHVDIYVPGGEACGKFLGLPVQRVQALRAEEYDRVIVAFLEDAEGGLAELCAQGIAPGKLVVLFSEPSVQG